VTQVEAVIKTHRQQRGGGQSLSPVITAWLTMDWIVVQWSLIKAIALPTPRRDGVCIAVGGDACDMNGHVVCELLISKFRVLYNSTRRVKCRNGARRCSSSCRFNAPSDVA